MTTAESTFIQRALGGPRLVRVAKRVAIIVTLLYLAVGIWSTYRAWDQVQQLELRVVSANLTPGLPTVVRIVTSGRAYANVQLELIQGSNSHVLATLRVAPSRNALFDPRRRQGSMMPSFTTEFLAQFKPGPAILRATATGVPMWVRTPPPVVREMPVIVATP